MLSKEFLSETEAQQTILYWWKQYYNYSSNDERFLTATKEQVYKDRLEYIIARYNEELGNNPQALRIVKGRAMDPEFDKKESENFKKDMERLIKEQQGKKDE